MATFFALRNDRSRRAAFVLDLAIIGLFLSLVAVGVPRWIQSAEQEKVDDALRYLDSVQQAQQDHLGQHGHYARRISELDIDHISPAYFSVGLIDSDTDASPPTWSLTLKRCAASRMYGEYKITYTENGYDRKKSDIDGKLLPNISR